MLEKIKLLLGITDNSKDDLLTLLTEQATEEAINYTNCEDINLLSSAIIKMVVYNYNRIGTEGVESENYSGVGFSYSADYPEPILRSLRKHRKLKTL